MEQPNYYAIIPADVRYDKNLRDKAKLLYGEITSLSDKNGYCWATNRYFAELYGVSTTTISTLIKELVDNGYIKSEVEYRKGTKEILNRYLKIFKDPYLKKFKEGIKENLKDNNTSINNTSINNTPYNPPKGENRVLTLNEELFKKFWAVYPRKVSKGNAEKWFKKNNPSKDVVELMVQKLEILKKTEQWEKNNGQYIPYPASWLNAKGWEDEINDTDIYKSEEEEIVMLKAEIEKRKANGEW